MSVAKKFLDENLGKVFLIQKQPPEVFCKKRCSQKFCIIHRKTPSQFCNFNKKRPWHRCFPVNFMIFLRTTFSYRTQPGDCLYWFLSSLTHHHIIIIIIIITAFPSSWRLCYHLSWPRSSYQGMSFQGFPGLFRWNSGISRYVTLVKLIEDKPGK